MKAALQNSAVSKPFTARVDVTRPVRSRCDKAPVRSVVTRTAVEEVDVITNGVVAAPSGRDAPGHLNFEDLQGIIRMVNDTDIVELELKSKKFTLAVKKREAIAAPEPPPQVAPVVTQQLPMSQPTAASLPTPVPQVPVRAAAASAPAAPAAPKADKPLEGVEISSPMSGTFYRSPAPGEPFFCKEGDRVTKGQTVGIIEAMKLMNEIEAEVSGTVVKVLVDSGKPVSPGQPLILIKP